MFLARESRPTLGLALFVDQPVASDGEQPGPEGVAVTFEPVQTARCGDPGFRRDVIRRLTRAAAQVAQQSRLVLREQLRERPLAARLRGGKDGLEVQLIDPPRSNASSR